ncbi:MAG: hypothetical protein LBC30_03920 [Puniceicoccales bacterium]|jgi:hypothetical protein|nr:hypothetical protein [Puniceicoccales bacterium]
MENRNAYIGQNVEILFRNTICDNPSVIRKIQEKFGIDGRFVTAINNGIQCEKADVKINFACGRNVDVNVKAYRGSGFNQLTRTSVHKFCTIFNINPEMERDLVTVIVNKAKNPDANLFSENDILRWHGTFVSLAKDLLHWGFSHKMSRELLVLYNRDTSKMSIYPMKNVLDLLCSRVEIVYTKGGFNICECVSFQRKGGNGSLSRTIAKTDIKHPGNDIQLKLKVDKFTEMAKLILLAEYVI